MNRPMNRGLPYARLPFKKQEAVIVMDNETIDVIAGILDKSAGLTIGVMEVQETKQIAFFEINLDEKDGDFIPEGTDRYNKLMEFWKMSERMRNLGKIRKGDHHAPAEDV